MEPAMHSSLHDELVQHALAAAARQARYTELSIQNAENAAEVRALASSMSALQAKKKALVAAAAAPCVSSTATSNADADGAAAIVDSPPDGAFDRVSYGVPDGVPDCVDCAIERNVLAQEVLAVECDEAIALMDEPFSESAVDGVPSMTDLAKLTDRIRAESAKSDAVLSRVESAVEWAHHRRLCGDAWMVAATPAGLAASLAACAASFDVRALRALSVHPLFDKRVLLADPVTASSDLGSVRPFSVETVKIAVGRGALAFVSELRRLFSDEELASAVDVQYFHHVVYCAATRHPDYHVDSARAVLLLVPPARFSEFFSTRDHRGQTPLVHAASRNAVEFVRFLLSLPNGVVDVNAKVAAAFRVPDADFVYDDDGMCGMTALSIAAHEIHVGVVEALLSDPRVDANLCDASGKTPLTHALGLNTVPPHPGRARVLSLLLSLPSARLDVNARCCAWERSALSYAVSAEHAEYTSLLLADPRVDVNARDRFLRTPLFYAKGGSLCLLHALGPKVNARAVDFRGRTPLHYAVGASLRSREYEDVRALLLLFGDAFDVNAQDKDGQTAVDLAFTNVCCNDAAVDVSRIPLLRVLLSDPRVGVSVPLDLLGVARTCSPSSELRAFLTEYLAERSAGAAAAPAPAPASAPPSAGAKRFRGK